MEEIATDLRDYKLMCFDGKVECCFVCSERYSGTGLKVTFFDNNWEAMPFERHYPKSEKPITRPQKYDEMVTIAQTLAKDLPFVRVDFYEVWQKVYVGELTLYPGCGFEEFTPQEWDTVLGNWLRLPKR